MVTLEHIATLSVITLLAVLFTLRRVMSWRLVFGYALPIDLTFTVVMIAVFQGTVSGAASATLAGLLLGVTLTVGKVICGYTRLTVKRTGLVTFKLVPYTVPGKVEGVCMGLRAWAANQVAQAQERSKH